MLILCFGAGLFRLLMEFVDRKVHCFIVNDMFCSSPQKHSAQRAGQTTGDPEHLEKSRARDQKDSAKQPAEDQTEGQFVDARARDQCMQVFNDKHSGNN